MIIIDCSTDWSNEFDQNLGGNSWLKEIVDLGRMAPSLWLFTWKTYVDIFQAEIP